MRLSGGERELEHPVLVSLLGVCIGLLVWLIPFALELEDENRDQQRLIAELVDIEKARGEQLCEAGVYEEEDC